MRYQTGEKSWQKKPNKQNNVNQLKSCCYVTASCSKKLLVPGVIWHNRSRVVISKEHTSYKSLQHSHIRPFIQTHTPFSTLTPSSIEIHPAVFCVILLTERTHCTLHGRGDESIYWSSVEMMKAISLTGYWNGMRFLGFFVLQLQHFPDRIQQNGCFILQLHLTTARGRVYREF